MAAEKKTALAVMESFTVADRYEGDRKSVV